MFAKISKALSYFQLQSTECRLDGKRGKQFENNCVKFTQLFLKLFLILRDLVLLTSDWIIR